MTGPRVLITGAGGLVGKGIRPFLAEACSELVLIERSPIETMSPNETIRRHNTE
jgi:FlaA1/EpsC-like NDP-sugar epimerase